MLKKRRKKARRDSMFVKTKSNVESLFHTNGQKRICQRYIKEIEDFDEDIVDTILELLEDSQWEYVREKMSNLQTATIPKICTFYISPYQRRKIEIDKIAEPKTEIYNKLCIEAAQEIKREQYKKIIANKEISKYYASKRKKHIL